MKINIQIWFHVVFKNNRIEHIRFGFWHPATITYSSATFFPIRSSYRAVTEQLQSSYGAVTEQFQGSSYGPLCYDNLPILERFQSN